MSPAQRSRTLTRPTSHDEQDKAENWRLQAECRDKATADYDPWHPIRSGVHNYVAGVEVCKGCPVRRLCLEFALAVETTEEKRYGIYGGKTPNERAEIAAKRRAS